LGAVPISELPLTKKMKYLIKPFTTLLLAFVVYSFTPSFAPPACSYINAVTPLDIPGTFQVDCDEGSIVATMITKRTAPKVGPASVVKRKYGYRLISGSVAFGVR
jgi:hypothetical protein